MKYLKRILFIITTSIALLGCNSNKKEELVTENNPEISIDEKYLSMNYSLNDSDFDYILEGDVKNLYLQQYNQHKEPTIIPFNQLFVRPIHLLLLDDLTKLAIKVLDDSKVDYVALFGTILSAERFNSLMPWDDDTDLGISLLQFKENMDAITSNMKAQGVFLHWDNCLRKKSDNDFYHCKMKLTKEHEADLIKRYEPRLTNNQISDLMETLYVDVDLFPLDITKTHIKHSDHCTQSQLPEKYREGYKIQDILPPKTIRLNNYTIKSVRNPEKFYEIWYGSQDIVYSLHMTNHINDSYQPVTIKDVRLYPDFIKLIHDYLQFVFADKFQGFPHAYNQL